MKSFVLSLFFVLGLCQLSFAQNHDILPKGFAEGEEALIPAYNEWRNSRSVVCETTPPSSSVRTMAEWEELQALAITWTGFTNILTQIVAAAKEEVEVVIICSNDAVVKNQLGAAGVDWSTGITFIEDEYDSIWMRDYGPNTVYLNDVETLAFVDWIYNRPRPDDDVVPEVIGNQMGIPVYCTTNAPLDVVHTGGNFMADGMGTGFSSELVLDENDASNQWGTSNHSEAEIDAIMEDFMGISLYPKMVNLPYDLIHHIDMHMKLLDESTLLVGEYPAGIADGPQIEANIQFILDNYTTPFGEPYKVIRIPMPPEGNSYPNTNGDYRTYTNAVFVNKTILLPTYEEPYDSEAIGIWETAMPGYNVVGINCNSIIPLSGAIHCITKEIGTDNPLLITHNSLNDVEGDNNNLDYTVEANIKHKEGINYALMYYKTDLSGSYSAVSMTNASGDVWVADIPNQPVGSIIYYYIQAESNDSKQQVRPITAPDGFYKFEILAPANTNDLLAESLIENIFPNPANAITCIPVYVPKRTTATIELVDVLGRKVTTIYSGEIASGSSKYFIDASNLTEGTYFVVMKGDQINLSQKLMVK